MDISDIIDDFNNGNLDVEKWFNDYETFFKILSKRGLISEIDPYANGSEEWQNEYLIWLYQSDKPMFYQDVVKLLDSDLEIDETGKIFLQTTDIGEFSKLFCSGNRNDIDRNIVEKILQQDGDVYEPHFDTTDDVYRDVVEELTPENDKRLQEYIVDLLGNTSIEPETEELELIASEQGNEHAIINLENVKRIIDDKESMAYLFKNKLSDLKSELDSVHSNAYNSAYESELYDKIWSKIQKYFDGNGEFFERPHKYKKNTNVQTFKIPVSSNFNDIILNYLHENKGHASSTLEYWGSYLSLLEDSIECFSVYAPDYPDSRKVDKMINEYFKDYI